MPKYTKSLSLLSIYLNESFHVVSDDFDTFKGDKEGSDFKEVSDEFILGGSVHLLFPLGVVHHKHVCFYFSQLN